LRDWRVSTTRQLHLNIVIKLAQSLKIVAGNRAQNYFLAFEHP
jgi:hypothetical protein